MATPFITRGCTELGHGSWIDHILYNGRPESIDIVGACNALGVELDDVLDHKPLWGLYVTSPPGRAAHTAAPKPNPRASIPPGDSRQGEAFRDQLSDVRRQLPPPPTDLHEAEKALEYATRFSVQLVQDLNTLYGSDRKRSSHKDGYSPEFMLRKWHLCVVLTLKRHLLGQHGKTRWVSLTTIQSGVTNLYQIMRARAASIGLDSATTARILSSSNYNELYWLRLGANITGS